MIPRLLGAALDALAVLSPIDCAGCGGADRGLCADCRRALVPAVAPRNLRDGSVIFTALRYEGVVRQALLALKEGGRTDVARPLGDALGQAVARAAEAERSRAANVTDAERASIEIVAVPTSSAAWRRRGYDPVALICKRAGIDVSRVLVHDRRTISQKTLGLEDRASNLLNSMRARRSLTGRRFLLVDDVVTTGATLTEAARAIHAAGGEVLGGAALAFTPRLFGRS
jgi:ComF family protein